LEDLGQKYKEKIDVAIRDLCDKGIIKKVKFSFLSLSFLSWLFIALFIGLHLVAFFLKNYAKKEASIVFLFICIGLFFGMIVSLVRDDRKENEMRDKIFGKIEGIYEIGMSSDNPTEAAYCYEKRFSIDWNTMWKWIKKEYLSKNK
jgi:hypothetical protein